MSEIKCETAILSAMSGFDGEQLSPLATKLLESHLAVCENCRAEIKSIKSTINLLQKQKRLDQTADLWSGIKNRIEPHGKETAQIGWNVLALLCAFLVAYKLLEMLPQEEFGFFFKFVPLVFVVVWFAFLRENPFRINTQLTLEK